MDEDFGATKIDFLEFSNYDWSTKPDFCPT
jgi:hypothetical protein